MRFYKIKTKSKDAPFRSESVDKSRKQKFNEPFFQFF